MSDIRIAGRPSSTTWILSPAADILFLVGTPVLIIPAIWVIARHFATPEQIDLAVASFASFAHHLPGFLRCYGDRDLFVRFRWRFLLAPPLFLAAAALFVFHDLHGMTLVLLIWGTWHGMMQTYGFMRIYDIKGGSHDHWSSHLDFALCAIIFAVGMVFSDARVNAVITGLWQCGIPVLDAAWLPRLRWLLSGFGALVVTLYVIHIVFTYRRGGVNFPKLLLALMTGGLYLLAGTATTNVLVGIAMFEVFHAAQYYAVVWTYNRRLAHSLGSRFERLARFVLQPGPLLALYAAAIAGFGCVRFFGSALRDPFTQKALLSIIATSTLLHFYFDGFIWKVRERSTPDNSHLQTSPARRQRVVKPLEHLAKCGLLAVVLSALFALEEPQDTMSIAYEDRLLDTIVLWTPDLPEVQSLASQAATRRGDTAQAVQLARQAVARRPRSYRSQATLGRALQAAGQFADAVAACEMAVQLGPRDWRCYHDLANALIANQQFQAASETATAGLATSRRPELLLSLGVALFEQSQFEAALEALEEATSRSTESAAAPYQLGLVYLRQKDLEHAARCFETAVGREPGHLQARFQLATIYYRTGRLASAARQFERCLADQEPFPELLNNLGAVSFELGHWEKAISNYKRTLELDHENAAAHYNLALAYYELGEIEDARRHLGKARQLGQAIPPRLLEELNQNR